MGPIDRLDLTRPEGEHRVDGVLGQRHEFLPQHGDVVGLEHGLQGTAQVGGDRFPGSRGVGFEQGAVDLLQLLVKGPGGGLSLLETIRGECLGELQVSAGELGYLLAELGWHIGACLDLRRCHGVPRVGVFTWRGHHAGASTDLQFAVDLERAMGDDAFAFGETIENQVIIAGAGAQGDGAAFEGGPLRVGQLDIDHSAFSGDQRRGGRDDQRQRPIIRVLQRSLRQTELELHATDRARFGLCTRDPGMHRAAVSGGLLRALNFPGCREGRL